MSDLWKKAVAILNEQKPSADMVKEFVDGEAKKLEKFLASADFAEGRNLLMLSNESITFGDFGVYTYRMWHASFYRYNSQTRNVESATVSEVVSAFYKLYSRSLKEKFSIVDFIRQELDKMAKNIIAGGK